MVMSAYLFVYWLQVTIQQLRLPDTRVLAIGASRTNHLRSAHAGAILQGMCAFGFAVQNVLCLPLP
jgi:hypothetical protein